MTETDVVRIGVLADPQRRRVYEHVASLREPATLTELSESLEMGRTLVAFHLGKLVDAGFVEALAAEATPGQRGRPSQRFRASRLEVTASVPARHYELVAEVLLLAAAEQRPDEPLRTTSDRVALRRGEQVGAAAVSDRPARTANGKLNQVSRLLSDLGYAPRREHGEIVLTNCPFDRLRDANCALVCGINTSLAKGYLSGLNVDDSVRAELRPCDDLCCVVITPA
jgi:predicted ArsR family transcriptional regulator